MKSTFASIVLTASSIILFSACASHPHTVKIQEDNAGAKKDIVVLKADKIRARSGRFDIHFTVKNATKQPIIILAKDFACFRGTFLGTIAYSTADGTLAFEPGEERGFNIHCTYNSDATGDYKIAINKIYDNMPKEHSTLGRTLTDSVTWSAKGD